VALGRRSVTRVVSVGAYVWLCAISIVSTVSIVLGIVQALGAQTLGIRFEVLLIVALQFVLAFIPLTWSRRVDIRERELEATPTLPGGRVIVGAVAGYSIGALTCNIALADGRRVRLLRPLDDEGRLIRVLDEALE
jgi:hypothetical protein